MKTLRRTALLLLMVGLSTFSPLLANDADRTGAQICVRQLKAQDKKAFIRISNLPEKKSAILRIKDSQGYTLHREVVNQGLVYAKRFDFSGLPDGEYIVELRTDNGIITESFVLEARQTTSLYFKPAIQQVDDLLKVTFLNSIDSPVSLKLYDEKGEVLYEETVYAQESFAKGIDMSKLKAGQYSLTLLGLEYVYAKSIQIP